MEGRNLNHSHNDQPCPISGPAVELLRRIMDAAGGEIQQGAGKRPLRRDSEHTIAVYCPQSDDQDNFYIGIKKILESGTTSTPVVTLVVASRGILEGNKKWGVTNPNQIAENFGINVVMYVSDDTPFHLDGLKSLIARELNRSGIPALQELSMRFVAEINREVPTPATDLGARRELGAPSQ
jgi:hypothetical protein